MATANGMKVTVVLNSGGQVAGASKQKVYTPASAGDEPVLSFGQAVGLGQTLLEIEVPAHVGALEGNELLSHLAEHASIKAAIENSSALRQQNSVAQGEEAAVGIA